MLLVITVNWYRSTPMTTSAPSTNFAVYRVVSYRHRGPPYHCTENWNRAPVSIFEFEVYTFKFNSKTRRTMSLFVLEVQHQHDRSELYDKLHRRANYWLSVLDGHWLSLLVSTYIHNIKVKACLSLVLISNLTVIPCIASINLRLLS